MVICFGVTCGSIGDSDGQKLRVLCCCWVGVVRFRERVCERRSVFLRGWEVRGLRMRNRHGKMRVNELVVGIEVVFGALIHIVHGVDFLEGVMSEVVLHTLFAASSLCTCLRFPDSVERKERRDNQDVLDLWWYFRVP